MRLTYIIHDYAGNKGENRRFDVRGSMADLVYKFRDKQVEIGITIVSVDGEPYQPESQSSQESELWEPTEC
jgi:hypothetical protein